MAPAKQAEKESKGETLLTLSEVSRRTGISMPTLQRYKKLYQDRIPSVGEGRRQRYKEESLEVFQELKEENISRRGRPRKSSGGKKKGSTGRGRKKGSKRTPPPKRKGTKAAAASESTGGEDLLTLTEVSKRTGISYPTLNRYMKLYSDQVPYEGKGRRRRYHPEAVEVFQRIRSESGRGGRKSSSSASTSTPKRGSSKKDSSTGGTGDAGMKKQVATLEKSVTRLEKKIDTLITALRKPRSLI